MSSDDLRRNSDNFCYRHPDRQSFVLCQRCLRTICPECQIQAPVGVICPECLAQQQASRTPAQKKAERRWARRPATVALGDTRPLATYAIIGITALVYLISLIPGFGGTVTDTLSFWAPTLYPEAFGVFQPWRLLTVSLVHSGFWHIGLNMLALWLIGRSLEPLLGRWRFIALYLISTLGGSVAVALLSFGTPVVGASGAVFGLFGALLIIGRHLGAPVTGIAIVLGINLVIGFIPGFNISWQAHVGGLIAGLLVAVILTQTRARSRRPLQIALLITLTVGLLALLLVPPVLYF
ncbi:rhomboid family intramembrane serine protease [Microbacterium kunmingense]|uniref:rhomboid family intramembrane serine protease n=1 Tax=Microbacterium kunmingense TaxID=2915939 RepID=UPI003D753689